MYIFAVALLLLVIVVGWSFIIYFLVEVLNMVSSGEKSEGPKPLTIIIGALELIVFGYLSWFFFTNEADSIARMSQLLATFGGWLAIKTLGEIKITPRLTNYKDHQESTRIHYKYLIGTIINVAGAVLFGFYFSNI